MLDLMILRNTLVKHGPSVRDRLRPVPFAWRDLRLLMTLVKKLQLAMLSTMPDSRQDYYQKVAQRGRVMVDFPGPARIDRYLMISERKLAAITEAAMLSECAMCLKGGREIRQCGIREALMEVAPPDRVLDTRDAMTGGCEYRDIAGDLVQGKTIQM